MSFSDAFLNDHFHSFHDDHHHDEQQHHDHVRDDWVELE